MNTLNSIGIVKNIVNLENGSTIVYIEDTTCNFVIQEVINFGSTNLKVGDLVNINYQKAKSSSNKLVDYAISKVESSTRRYASNK